MATPQQIAAKVAFGYAKAGQKLGFPHDLYRPTLATVAALDQANKLCSLPFVSSATPDGAFRRPGKIDETDRFGLFDTRDTLAGTVRLGDYIDGPTGTFFVSTLEPLEPVTVVLCNAVLSGTRAVGIQPGYNLAYGGRTDANDVVQFIDWPGALIDGGSSEAGRAMLPSDPRRFAGAICRLPRIPGVTFRAGDQIMAKDGDSWMIAGAILHPQGWRLTLGSAEA